MTADKFSQLIHILITFNQFTKLGFDHFIGLGLPYVIFNLYIVFSVFLFSLAFPIVSLNCIQIQMQIEIRINKDLNKASVVKVELGFNFILLSYQTLCVLQSISIYKYQMPEYGPWQKYYMSERIVCTTLVRCKPLYNICLLPRSAHASSQAQLDG